MKIIVIVAVFLGRAFVVSAWELDKSYVDCARLTKKALANSQISYDHVLCTVESMPYIRVYAVQRFPPDRHVWARDVTSGKLTIT